MKRLAAALAVLVLVWALWRLYVWAMEPNYGTKVYR